MTHMRNAIILVFVGFIVGGVSGFFFRSWKEVSTPENNISFNYAITKAFDSVVYLYSADCNDGLYGCPLGTGVIMDTNGHIITNYHVIKGKKKIQIILNNGDIFTPTYLAHDDMTDLAVLTITTGGKKLKPINLAIRSSVGDIVIAIGNPYNLLGSATQGIISALGRNGLGRIGRQSFIQTDASINKGNSGGPLLNTKGEMIGLNTMVIHKVPDVQRVEGIGFALPTTLVVSVMTKLINDGMVIRGCIGIEATDVQLQVIKGISPHVTMVSLVRENGPADNAGIKKSDILASIAHQPVMSVQQALDIIADSPPETIVPVSINRNGTSLNKKVTVEKCEID
ncbi:trypsin-like peptidase domain-containing protein [Serratia fonticola]|uniref:trypsin-like peptidase domain-containing protein n=1 Tax=Serratia fonticola TaxID=47917 RepID=UPI001415423A|nr:trypsin-like peptidase domain-containing protein [Serratia fonticola]QIP94539.1 outer membrane stress sensor protease [Serratia fonticola]